MFNRNTRECYLKICPAASVIYWHVLKSADVQRERWRGAVQSQETTAQEFVLSWAIQRSSDVQRSLRQITTFILTCFKILVSGRRSSMSSCFQWGPSEREVSGLSFRCKLSRQDFLLVAFSLFFFFFFFKELCYITWAVNRDNRCPQWTPRREELIFITKKK